MLEHPPGRRALAQNNVWEYNNGSTVQWAKRWAKTLQANVLVGYAERISYLYNGTSNPARESRNDSYVPSASDVYNSAVLISSSGEEIATIRKKYITDVEKRYCKSANEPYTIWKSIVFGNVGIAFSDDFRKVNKAVNDY